MLALISFVIIVLFSLLVVKIGSVALEATGLSKDVAMFQAQSAFSGVGFTTEESEMIMRSPVRRKILSILMLIGSAGLTTAIATLILTFISNTNDVLLGNFKVNAVAFNLFIIIGSLVFLLGIAQTKQVDRFVRRVLKKPLNKLKQKVNLYDYETILGLSKGYGIVSFKIHGKHWMTNKKISTLSLDDEGIVVMGVEREIHGHEEYFGAPTPDFVIHSGDKVVVYSRETAAANLSQRETGVKGIKDRENSVAMYKSYQKIQRIDEAKAKTANIHKMEHEKRLRDQESASAKKKKK